MEDKNGQELQFGDVVKMHAGNHFASLDVLAVVISKEPRKDGYFEIAGLSTLHSNRVITQIVLSNEVEVVR